MTDEQTVLKVKAYVESLRGEQNEKAINFLLSACDAALHFIKN